MISDEIRQKLQNIVRGDVLEGQEDHCTAIRNLLCQSFGSDPTVKKEFESRSIIKEEQARFLKAYAEDKGFWLQSLPEGCQYLTMGESLKFIWLQINSIEGLAALSICYLSITFQYLFA
jgi:hypothetical protein